MKESEDKDLLVTFPVDLGNRTIEANLQEIFKEDMDFYRFAAQHAGDIDFGKVSLKNSIKYRVASASQLRRKVKKYNSDGKSVLFNGISPALFSYGTWSSERTAITLDWTRTLYPSVLSKPIKKDIAFYLHKKVLNSCQKILCGTDALSDNLQDIYGVKESAIYKVPVPFLVENLDIPPRKTPLKPKVLFVGGDLIRKGGDVLIEGWKKYLSTKCFLTMMTNDRTTNVEGITYLRGIQYGSVEHRKVFEEHDILILPTRIDSYPQVIGEAAAAGLVVVTTRFALAANKVVTNGKTGYIADSPEESIRLLNELLDDIERIDNFKKGSYDQVHKNFSKKAIRTSYMDVLKS